MSGHQGAGPSLRTPLHLRFSPVRPESASQRPPGPAAGTADAERLPSGARASRRSHGTPTRCSLVPVPRAAPGTPKPFLSGLFNFYFCFKMLFRHQPSDSPNSGIVRGRGAPAGSLWQP